MRWVLALVVAGVALAGCGQGEVSNADQATKMKALHDAEKDSRAKDGIKSD